MDSTEVLVAKVKQGDARARDELYRRHGVRLLFLVRTRVGPQLQQAGESFDRVQDVLLRSLERLEKFEYRDDAAFLEYLSNDVVQALRDTVEVQPGFSTQALQDAASQNSVAGHAAASLAETVGLGGGTSPVDVVEQHGLLRQLASAMDQLRAEDEDSWQLLVRRKLEGCELVTLANELSSTEEAIRQRLCLAQAKLARIYATL